MIKAVKVLNVFSTLLFAAILLMVYAYLPINVDMNVSELGDVHKQSFFYYSVGIFVTFNVLLRLIVGGIFSNANPLLRSWMSGLIFILNFYFTTMVGFIGVWNNSTSITPSDYAYLNFMGPVLLIIWVVGLIFLVLKKS